tara:strand:+ start:10695 stop:11300 length:606 start_codon:yes stop_codon:yes gene_type:complete
MGEIDFKVVEVFEKQIAAFFNAPYAIAVDGCTHAIELCLRYTGTDKITVPKHTYLSIPFLSNKLNIGLEWKDEDWSDYYYLTENVIDAAVLWKRDSYVPNTFMNISFQFRKHLKLGRGGVILCDDEEAALQLKKMSYDGRRPDVPWRNQDIETIGYHYYMTPETAQLGIDLLPEAIVTEPVKWVLNDWPDLTKLTVFKDRT